MTSCSRFNEATHFDDDGKWAIERRLIYTLQYYALESSFLFLSESINVREKRTLPIPWWHV